MVSIASPELTFIQMARDLDTITLVEFGYALCGTYFYSPWSSKGFEQRDPLTTKASLLTCLSGKFGGYGIRDIKLNVRVDITRKALPWQVGDFT